MVNLSGIEANRKRHEHAQGERNPDNVEEGVALALDLANRGLLEQISERFRIRREGGYCGFDVLLFLLLYFAASADVGIRKFWEAVRGCKRRWRR